MEGSKLLSFPNIVICLLSFFGAWFHLKRCKHTSATPEDNVNLVKLNLNTHYMKLCKYSSCNL